MVGDTVYFGNLDGNLQAHDMETGALRWRFALSAPADPVGLTIATFAPERGAREVDLDLETLENLNTPEAYDAALRLRRPLRHVELHEVARRRAGTDAPVVDPATPLRDGASLLLVSVRAGG